MCFHFCRCSVSLLGRRRSWLVLAAFVALFFAAAGVSASEANPGAAGEPAAPAISDAVLVRGIYVSQPTLESPKKLDHLIQSSLEVGVNTFVVDLWVPSSRYVKTIERLTKFGIRYVPRITVFPHGGSPEQIRSQRYWESRWKLVDYALKLGAKDIQLDYIRYRSRNDASPKNAADILKVIQFFQKRIHERGARLQIDIFGEAAHAPSLHIGQDMGLFASSIDGVCPMVYPSHYQPYAKRAKIPYKTVRDSLEALKVQLGTQPVKIYAYIELWNHRYRLELGERVNYVREELRAVSDAKVHGFYAWSASNKYDLLFEILKRFPDKVLTATAVEARL